MSWQSLLTDAFGGGAIPDAAQSYVRGVVISEGVRAGASANAILLHLVGHGIGVRRTQGLAIVRQEQARQAAGATANALDLSQPVSSILAANAPGGFTGNYVHQVAITYRTRDEEGNYMLNTVTRAISSPTVLSPEEAVSAATEMITTNPAPTEGTPEVLPESIMMASLSGAWYQVHTRFTTSSGGS